MQVSKIINGWYNYVSKDTETEKIALSRAKKCAVCPHKRDSKVFGWVKDDIKEVSASVCNACEGVIKCPIAMKVRSINEKCPKNEW